MPHASFDTGTVQELKHPFERWYSTVHPVAAAWFAPSVQCVAQSAVGVAPGQACTL
jgi:hypothetical protein